MAQSSRVRTALAACLAAAVMFGEAPAAHRGAAQQLDQAPFPVSIRIDSAARMGRLEGARTWAFEFEDQRCSPAAA